MMNMMNLRTMGLLLSLVAVSYGQSRLTSPVIVNPPGGGTSAQIWLRESMTAGSDQVKIRVPALPGGYDLVLPTAPANGGDCLKQTTTSSTVLALTLGACGGASDWQVVSGNLTPVVPTNPVRFRQWTIEDTGGGGLTWTAYGDIGNPAAATNRFAFYDNAAQPVLEMQRTFLGTITNNMIVDMNVIPRTDGTRSLGAATSRFAFGHINELRSNFLTPPVGSLEINGDVVVTTGNSVGLPSQRIPKIWVQDFDCSGVGCPGGASVWSRNASLGYLEPTTNTDDVWVKKLVFKDTLLGSGLAWDMFVEAGNPATQPSHIFIRDPAGVKVVDFARTGVAGTVINEAIFDLSITPLTNNTRYIGKSGRVFSESHILTMYTQGLELGGGATSFSINGDMNVNGNILPTAGASPTAAVGNSTFPYNVGTFRNLYTFAIVPISGTTVEWFNNLVPHASGVDNIGSPSNRVGTVYTTNIDCLGGVCPGSKWTDTGVTTYLTNTGDNVAIGLASTTFKFEVAGTSKLDGDVRIGGDLFWNTDGAGDIGVDAFGTTYLRPNSIHATTAYFVYNGVGSTQIRMAMSLGGLQVYNSAGTNVASITSNTGRISSNAGFTVSGVNGVSVTTSGGCVVSGGIITDATCLP